jgi:hypothetical protein
MVSSILRNLTLFCALLLSSRAFAGSAIGFGFGAITAHVNVGPGYKNYCNQIEKSDVILNNVAFLRVEGKTNVITAMLGEDSICSPIQGLFYNYKFVDTKWFGLSWIIGGYHFDYDNWLYEENHIPPGRVAVSPVYTKIGTFYFVPVGGLEMDIGLFHWGARENWSLNFNAILTPVIIPMTLSFKYSF